MSSYLPLLLLASTVSAQATLQSVISTYGLTAASFNYTAPTRALESGDAYDWIKENWDLTGNKVDYGINDLCVLLYNPNDSAYIQSIHCGPINSLINTRPPSEHENPLFLSLLFGFCRIIISSFSNRVSSANNDRSFRTGASV